MLHKASIGLLALLAASLPLTAHADQTLGNAKVGRQTDGTVVTSTDQVITPAGTQVEFVGRPFAVALNPNGKTAAYLTGYNVPIIVVDLATNTIKQQFTTTPNSSSASFDGLIYSKDGKTLYASQSSVLLIMNVAADGTLTQNKRVTLSVNGGNPHVGGMAFSADGTTLYMALSISNALGVFDVVTQKLTKVIPVGNAPYGVTLVGNLAYVTNQGGRPAVAGDITVSSAGTPIVASPINGAPITGTVSVVDLTQGKQINTIPVGIEPTAMTLYHQFLFVANTNSDSISVIDTTSQKVVKTISTQPFPNAPYGASPNALLMTRGPRLVVSLGRSNALAVYNWQGPANPVELQGLIPTAWYPNSLVEDPSRQQIIVANNKGVGSLGPFGTIYNVTSYYVHSYKGSTSLIPTAHFDPSQLAVDTAQVAKNNSWDKIDTAKPSPAAAPVAIPQHVGEPSLIKHVFYIIKENRTYDQLFGDLTDTTGNKRGNGDPTLTIFGKDVTPNHHALAQIFPCLDNTYCSGSLSADGHQWVTQALAPDYLEKFFGAQNRSYPFDGGDSLAYLPSGFIWENAQRKALSVRAYGEYANQFVGPVPFQALSGFGLWKDWYSDALALAQLRMGNAATLKVPLGTYATHSDVPSLDAILNRDFPGYNTTITDQYRVEMFLREFNQYVKSGKLPDFITMTLICDHTTGTSANYPTPRAQVADNDYALGRVVEAISNSPFWRDTAIFVVEDDAQAGVDHVDGHRTPAFVISPYAKRGAVISTYYTQVDITRTIEQILGLPAMHQLDLAASPMRDAFTDTPDFTPYTALTNIIPLNELNPGSTALKDVEKAWELASTKMFAKHSLKPDDVDENLLNRAIWYSATHFKKPYPGDKKILYPNQVTPAAVRDRD